ncbi:MAG: cytochrome-c peroxidase [Candidatus Brocadiales bacterium]
MHIPLLCLVLALLCNIRFCPAHADEKIIVTKECTIIKEDGRQKVKAPLGLPDLEVPADNPMTPEKVALGKRLYFDKRLSFDDTVSCATCHDLRLSGTDAGPVSTGIAGQKGGRSAPPSVNAAYMDIQFWDGRAPSLEEQAKGPPVNPIEMGMPSHDFLVEKLKGIEEYRKDFQKVFNGEITIDNIVKAIAAYERTLLSANSPFDRFRYGGEEDAISELAKVGMGVFVGKGRCVTCHTFTASHALFTDNNFHNIGVGMNKENPDLGRYLVTGKEKDKGAFKTSSLRNIALTAPYMHDGSEATLEDVVAFYNRGGNPNPNLDGAIMPLNLTYIEKMALVEFMKSLTSSDLPEF